MCNILSVNLFTVGLTFLRPLWMCCVYSSPGYDSFVILEILESCDFLVLRGVPGLHLSAEETEGMWHVEVTQRADAPTMSCPGKSSSWIWNFLLSHRGAWVRGQAVRCCSHASGILRMPHSLLNLLQYCFCFMFWFFGPVACGILVPQPDIKPTPLALEGEALTTELPRKFRW